MKRNKMISLIAAMGTVGAIGCGGDSGSGEVTKVDGDQTSQFVATKLTLPKNATTAAFDLNGDGTADNRLGNIIQAVTALNLDPQSAADTSVMTGALILLIGETSTDATGQEAKNAGTKVTLGLKPATAPKFDGTDTFTVDTSTQAAQFYGNITAGVFTSNNPATTKNPVTLTIALPLVEGQPALKLPVTAGHLTFKRGTDGKITGGQLNGAIKKEDVDGVIIPAVAGLITAQLQAPMPSASLKMFDTNMDGTVSADEIKNNALIANFLAPDVQIFQGGVYSPNPQNAMKDSLSLGLSFEAVGAHY